MTTYEALEIAQAAVDRVELERDAFEATLRNIMELCENDAQAIRIANEVIAKYGRNE